MTLTSETFESFFLKATGNCPYPYQAALAEEPIQNRLLHVPTGAGKTAAVVMAWLWRQLVNKEQTPRRLIYCLPMRALVEQTRKNIDEWFGRIGADIKVYTLMGADLEEEWESHPEAPAVLVGTQDMLLSRALNRGYGMSRYRWPLHFGLLNNDCLWIFDEIQLMGAGLPSSTQLAAFRETFSTFGPVASIWMSATLNRADMQSVDFAPMVNGLQVGELTAADIEDPRLRERLRAVKKLTPAPASCRTPEGLAAFVIQNHRPGTQAVVVVNRVERARDTYDALAQSYRDTAGGPELLLLHSRFRPAERRWWQGLLGRKPEAQGRIIVSTQVIEAGVDISSTLLVTDLAPYSSLVQRFGRCNRNAEVGEARIFWVDRPLAVKQAKLAELAQLDEKQQVEVALPYDWTELELAESLVANMASANPASLPPTPPAAACHHVLRRRDLVDLFDTSRDLSGFDIDISRFVRGGEEHDVLVAWRDLRDSEPPEDCPAPIPDELCPVPISEMRSFLKTGLKGRARRVAWTWDALEGQWTLVSAENMAEHLRPGLILLVACDAGGYDVQRGWDASSFVRVPVVPAESDPEEPMSGDPLSERNYRQSLSAHSREVLEMLDAILARLAMPDLLVYLADLRFAALHHDVGKAHPVFQATLSEGTEEPGPLLAKSKSHKRHALPYFRHELASALALYQAGASDLAAYLTAAHHGKIRLSIRTFPGEKRPEDPQVRFARGIRDGDQLPPVTLDGAVFPAVTLSLEPMLLGRSGTPSWLERAIALLDQLGSFRLAYLEALIRIADERASAAPSEVLP